MSEFKGTLGPWVVEDKEFVMDQNGNCIAAFGGFPATYRDNANALLCSAAPELLEALRQLRDYVQDMHCNSYDDCLPDHPMVQATSVIKKALGQ